MANPGIQGPNGKTGVLWRLTHLEPTVYRTAVVAVVALLVSFGIKVSPEIPDAIIGFIAAIALIVQVVWIRGGVMPTSKVVSYLPEPVDAPEALRAGTAVTTASNAQIIEAATVHGSEKGTATGTREVL